MSVLFVVVVVPVLVIVSVVPEVPVVLLRVELPVEPVVLVVAVLWPVFVVPLGRLVPFVSVPWV